MSAPPLQPTGAPGRAVLVAFVSGAIAMGYAVAGLFFLRFWRQSRDRLFAFFAAAFFILGVHRVLLVAASDWVEDRTWYYALRLLAFALILVAIADKNRASR